jgi:hypothetical protein
MKSKLSMYLKRRSMCATRQRSSKGPEQFLLSGLEEFEPLDGMSFCFAT